ncbi:MAG: hypothetical protein HUJ52_03730, partial [Malacoplasma sp.]|nr:hypothetical protein [Malacoplasma sp.]
MKASASSSTGYYIDQFSTTYDKYNKRQNKYVDIKYGEMNITFNENKILVNLLVHVAGNFNLPAGSLVANLIMPGQDLSQINLYKQNTGIPSTFAYGYPDASSVYSGQFTLDVNEDKFLSNNINSSFQINTNFSLNTSQLNNIGEDQINSSSLSNFISELQNVSLVFNIDLYQKNAIDLSLSNIINVNQISSIWLASQTVDTNNNSVGSQQKNTTTPFQFLGFDYTNLNTGFSNLFTIKKTNNSNKKYIYLRKRELARITSTYVGPYSEALYDLVCRQCKQVRELLKQIRHVDRILARMGYQEKDVTNKILLNIDIARSRFKDLIYNQGVLEGVAATYAQTETILENGKVNGVATSDILKIVNLKSAWDFILDNDVIRSKQDFNLYSTIARLVNDKLLYFPDQVRTTKSKISGCKVYEPPIPSIADVKDNFNKILKSKKTSIDIAIELCLYCMKAQIFNDGNKRCGIIFANHYLISKGEGLLVIESKNVDEFRNLL